MIYNFHWLANSNAWGAHAYGSCWCYRVPFSLCHRKVPSYPIWVHFFRMNSTKTHPELLSFILKKLSFSFIHFLNNSSSTFGFGKNGYGIPKLGTNKKGKEPGKGGCHELEKTRKPGTFEASFVMKLTFFSRCLLFSAILDVRCWQLYFFSYMKVAFYWNDVSQNQFSWFFKTGYGNSFLGTNSVTALFVPIKFWVWKCCQCTLILFKTGMN